MARHLQMRSANPALNFSDVRTGRYSQSEVMTMEGTVNKTLFSLFLLTLAASYSWSNPGSILMPIGMFGGTIMALITIFKKTWSQYTVTAYSVLKGLFLGGISYKFESRYPGIASQAVFLTFSVLGVLLLAYRSKWIVVTDKFRLGVVAATGGIFLVYFIGFIMSFFGSGLSFLHNSSMISIGFSLLVVGIASMNLVLDFDFIESSSERGLPKYMEWYGAFALLVTLIWLYIEILRLLSKLNSRR